MHKYTIGLVASIVMTVLSVSAAISVTDPDMVVATTIAIMIFWFLSLIFVFLRGLVWYRADLAERTMEEIERQEEESIDDEVEDDGFGFTFKDEENN